MATKRKKRLGRPPGRSKKGAIISAATIKLRISKPLLQEIDRLSGPGKRSLYIKRALAHYIRVTAPDYDAIDKRAITMI